MTTATIVIPWRDTHPTRARDLSIVLRHLAPLGWPVVLADDPSRPDFNRAAARNQGVHQSSTDVVLLHDADMLVPHEQLTRAATQADATHRMVIAYTTYRAITDPATDRIAHGDDPFLDIHSSDIWQRTSNSTGGVYAIRSDDYQRIGGHDTSYTGWGYEDTAFHRTATRTLGPVLRIPGDAIHLWHPNECAPHTPHYQANRARYYATTSHATPNQ